MDAQLLIAVNVMAFSGLIAAALIARRDWNFAWNIATHLFILGVGGCALYFAWPHAGTLTGSLFVVLFVLPVGLMWFSQRKAASGDKAGAVRYAQWAAVVHPTPVMRLSAGMTAAQAIDDPEQSAAAFRALAGSMPARNQVHLAMAAERAIDNWPQVLALVASDPTGASHAVMKIRGLGETGRVQEMVEAYNAVRLRLPGDERAVAELFVLAFAGRAAAVARYLDARRSAYDAETRTYWQGVANLHAGQPDDGMLMTLALSTQRGATRRAIKRHLHVGAFIADANLTQDARTVVATIEARTARSVELAALPRWRSFATLTLLLANAVMFGVEGWSGGFENLQTLYRLGGLWPAALVNDGEWWRLATALFLHFGWAHFLINMVSLYALGRAIEARFGTTRMLVIYAIGGVGSSAAVLALMRWGWITEALLVGASGAVMALFGAILADQLVKWRTSRDALDRGPVVALLAIIALQTLIDLNMPHVSLAGHLSGFVGGFFVALVILRVWPKRTPVTATS